MNNVPEGILCSQTNEWVLEEGNDIFSIGLSDIYVEKMGDIVFVELPEVNQHYKKDEAFATIESVKNAYEIFMPISGRVVEINENLINSPELINEDAFASWLIKIKADDFQNESQGLLDYDDYRDEVQ